MTNRRNTCLSFLFAALAAGFAQAADDTKVDRILIVRRALDGSLPRVGLLAHSGLLLHTSDGRFYLLEYMNDGKAHLTSVAAQTLEAKANHKIIEMPGRSDNGLRSFTWTSQLRGKAIERDNVTPKQLQKLMGELMKGRYDVVAGDHCHEAQERLRKALRIF